MTQYYVCIALAVLASVGMLWATRYGEEQIRRVPLATMALCCIPLAFVCARLAYCLFRYDYYFQELGAKSLLNIADGGFLLYGAMFGTVIAAALAACARRSSVPKALDELVVPGMFCIALCRLAESLVCKGVGPWIDNPLWQRFPFAVTNSYGEWQMAIFFWEAVAAILILYIAKRVMRKPFPVYLRGEAFLTALLLYACCQIVFESLRTDAVLKIGFVRVSQVISAAIVFLITMIRAVRYGGGAGHVIGFGLLILALIGCVGGIEWALDKTAISNRTLYALMVVACLFMAIAGTRARRHTKWTIGAIKAKRA